MKKIFECKLYLHEMYEMYEMFEIYPQMYKCMQNV